MFVQLSLGVWRGVHIVGQIISVLFNIPCELVEHGQLRVTLLAAFGQQFWVLNFHCIDSTLQDADISQRLSFERLAVKLGVTRSNQTRAKRIALVLTVSDHYNQTVRIVSLVGVQKVDVGVDLPHVRLSDLSTR